MSKNLKNEGRNNGISKRSKFTKNKNDATNMTVIILVNRLHGSYERTG